MNFGDVILSFLPRFALGLSVNFSIALSALALGLMLGLPLAAARRGARWLAAPARAVLGLLRFFLHHLRLPRTIYLRPRGGP